MGLSDYLRNVNRSLYELTTTSPFYRCYGKFSNYVCSGYFSDKPFKTEVRPRIWNEDVQDLHFPDSSFDLVISSETMEHVRDPWKGFREIYRVLKPGGFHCFTIPYRPDRRTVARVLIDGPNEIDILPRVYHMDPYRPQDSLVYTDFGSDLADLLTPIGFRTSEFRVWNEKYDIRDDLQPMRVFLSEKVA